MTNLQMFEKKYRLWHQQYYQKWIDAKATGNLTALIEIPPPPEPPPKKKE